MKTTLFSTLFFAMLFPFTCVGIAVTFGTALGCQNLSLPNSTQPSSQAQQVSELWTTYTVSLDALQFGVQSGYLSQSELTNAAPYLNAIYVALHSASIDIAAGRPAAQTDLDSAAAAALSLAPLLAKAKGQKTDVGNDPTGNHRLTGDVANRLGNPQPVLGARPGGGSALGGGISVATSLGFGGGGEAPRAVGRADRATRAFARRFIFLDVLECHRHRLPLI